MKKVADQLIDQLVQAGIKRIYAITGDSLNELNDAVRRRPDLQWIHVRNEEAGAFAASADAQLTGIACCAGSSGPGHVHLVNGLYDAQRSGAPVVAIASAVFTWWSAGGNVYLDGHHSRLSFKYQTRPLVVSGRQDGSKGSFVLATQVYL
jgi:TPP-dependent 2-oxoacid decarboxylase